MPNCMKIACAVPPVRVGDVKKNAADICRFIRQAGDAGVKILVFPELCVTGYTCGDLFFQKALIRAAAAALVEIAEFTRAYPGMTCVVGAPVEKEGRLYNCAVVICAGEILDMVSNDGADRRWFSSDHENRVLSVDGYQLAVEFDEQLCDYLAEPRADIIVNLSAARELIGEHRRRSNAVALRSRAGCLYAFCSAGYTESTQDVVYSGHAAVACCGEILAETVPQPVSDTLLICDCDMGHLSAYDKSDISVFPAETTLQKPNRLPFVAQQPEERAEQCTTAFHIQVTGLMQRLSLLGAKPVIGVSGGLDSTLALLVAVEAVRRLGRPTSDVHGITMPCFGTSDRTYQNAWELMKNLGITCKEINIRDAVTQHFRDIGHDMNLHNGTYENSQARERTQILMDYAGMVGGIVVGTGDLSELALGWCTYNGDHMSMYSVNASVPKTLIPAIIETVSDMPQFRHVKPVLMDVVDTPISPELLPPDEQGKIAQQTEDLVGPYVLHDFFIYYMVGHGLEPTEIYSMACETFAGEYDSATVKKWLGVFYRRFFTQQFKRNCLPDGARVGAIGLTRGDLMIPSDASGKIWLDEVERL